jgi:hypothetical protein
MVRAVDFCTVIRCLHECKNDCAIEFIDLHSGKRHFTDIETKPPQQMTPVTECLPAIAGRV